MDERSRRFKQLSPRTLRFDVVESIRDAIHDGRLPAGSPLVEARIAEEMGISRAPVREALRRLEQEGLVISIPYKGTYITEVTPEVMLEIANVRTMLETYAVTRALPRLRSGAFDRLRGYLSDMRMAAARQDAGLMVEAHLGFHRTPYELASNALLLQFWRIMEGQISLYLRVNHLTFGTLDEIADSHERFLRTVESGDLDAIRAHIVEHVELAAEQLVQGPRPRGVSGVRTRIEGEQNEGPAASDDDGNRSGSADSGAAAPPPAGGSSAT